MFHKQIGGTLISLIKDSFTMEADTIGILRFLRKMINKG